MPVHYKKEKPGTKPYKKAKMEHEQAMRKKIKKVSKKTKLKKKKKSKT